MMDDEKAGLDGTANAPGLAPIESIEPSTPEPEPKPEPVEAPTSGVAASGARWAAVGDGTYRVTCNCGWRYTAPRPGMYHCNECRALCTIP